MSLNIEKRQAFVEALAAENKIFYDTPNGRGALKAFEVTFENRWIYIFELIKRFSEQQIVAILKEGEAGRRPGKRHLPQAQHFGCDVPHLA